MLKPVFSGQFKKDYKLSIKRGHDKAKLKAVIDLLCAEKPLANKHRDHLLQNSRNYKNVRECHIESDWLLIYRIVQEERVLKLIRCGTHSDLF